MNPPQQLIPPNEKNHVLLPGHSEPASAHAETYHSVVKVYQNGLAMIDPMGVVQGHLTGHLTVVCGFCGLAGIFWAYWMISAGMVLLALVMAVFALVCLMIIRADVLAFRYQPIVFNRATQQVHRFIDEGVAFAPPWQLKPRFRIETWDWNRIRAELVEFVALDGANVPYVSYTTNCAVTEEPGSMYAGERFGFGEPSQFDAAPILNQWEHIRRFMAGQGPHLAEDDKKFEQSRLPGLIESLTWGQPLLGPGSRAYWTGEAFYGMWYLTVFASMFFLPLLPFTALAGLMRSAALHARHEPAWPKEIQASLGPEIKA